MAACDVQSKTPSAWRAKKRSAHCQADPDDQGTTEREGEQDGREHWRDAGNVRQGKTSPGRTHGGRIDSQIKHCRDLVANMRQAADELEVQLNEIENFLSDDEQ